MSHGSSKFMTVTTASCASRNNQDPTTHPQMLGVTSLFGHWTVYSGGAANGDGPNLPTSPITKSLT